jgi:hypothetical protein
MKTSASRGESKSEGNHHETIDFFRVIYSNCESGMVNLRFKQPKAKKAWNQFVNVNDIGDLPRILQKNQKVHCWFGVSLRNGRSGKKDHIALIPAVWLDHDDVTEEMEKKIREVLPPTAVVQTSEPTKRHYYWVLKEACGPEEINLIEDINRRLVDYFGGCNGSWEAAHVMRIPGTFHLKDPKNPLKCTLLELNTSCQYNPSDFEILPSVKTESTNGYQGASSKDPNDCLIRIMKCEFLRHCDRDRADLPEPHWYAMVNILAHETGGKKLIHDLSIGYPKYSPLETDQKILHALDTAPYTCARIKLIWNCGRNCGVRSPIGLGSEKNLSGSEESKNLLWLPDGLMTGLVGDFADLYGNYVESPNVFLFFGLLTCLGSILSGRLTLASEISPPPRFYTVCLGESAVDRKSSGIDHVVEFLMEFFRDSLYTCLGVGSAEGLQAEITDTPHGRLLLLYDEFRAFISKCKIQASVLLDCVNTLFEKTTYQSRTKTSNIKVEKAHLSLLAATTIQTYQNLWTSQFLDIGFPNRLFLVPGRGKRKYSIPQKVPATGKKGHSRENSKNFGPCWFPARNGCRPTGISEI